MLLKEKVILLKNFPLNEADLIIKGLNPKGGQMSFIAKGALKSRRRFCGGVLDPLSYIEIGYRPSRKSLLSLQEARLLEDFCALRRDYSRLSLALEFARLISSFSPEGAEDSGELFHLLGNGLKEAQNSPALPRLKLFFYVKALFLQGVLPSKPDYNAISSQALREHKSFDIGEKEVKKLLDDLSLSLESYLSA